MIFFVYEKLCIDIFLLNNYIFRNSSNAVLFGYEVTPQIKWYFCVFITKDKSSDDIRFEIFALPNII